MTTHKESPSSQHSTSNASRNTRVSTKSRPAPKPPSVKNTTQDNYDKGVVSQMGSLKKRRAPPPPKVPDTIAETPDSPGPISGDSLSKSNSDQSGTWMTSTPMHDGNDRRASDPPPPPQPVLGESVQEYDASKSWSTIFSNTGHDFQDPFETSFFLSSGTYTIHTILFLIRCKLSGHFTTCSVS